MVSSLLRLSISTSKNRIKGGKFRVEQNESTCVKTSYGITYESLEVMVKWLCLKSLRTSGVYREPRSGSRY